MAADRPPCPHCRQRKVIKGGTRCKACERIYQYIFRGGPRPDFKESKA